MRRDLSDFEALVVAEMPVLFRQAMKLCGRHRERAEDLVQTAVCNAIEAKDRFVAGTNHHAWLSVILRNAFYTDVRRRRLEVEDPDGALAHVILTHRDDPCDRMIARETLDSIALLPAKDRDVLFAIGGGAQYDEVAHELNVPVGTIKSRAARARETLGVML